MCGHIRLSHNLLEHADGGVIDSCIFSVTDECIFSFSHPCASRVCYKREPSRLHVCTCVNKYAAAADRSLAPDSTELDSIYSSF